MRRISESVPMEGLPLVNPKYPLTRYLPTKKFVMVEFDVDNGKEFVSVYLRRYENNKTLLTAYLPELEYLEYLKIFNKAELIKFLSRSKTFSDTFKAASKIGNTPFLSKVHDFTEYQKNVDVMCIQNIIDIPLTPKIIDEDYPEYIILERGVNEIVHVAVEYLNIRMEHLRDLKSSYWVNKVNSSQVNSVIKKCEVDGFWGTFFNKLDGIQDSELRDYIREHKVVIMCKNMTYGLGFPIQDEEDKKCDATAVIMADVFNESLKGSDYILCVDLEYYYGEWRPKVNLGELIEGVSIALNHVNTQKWAKIDESAYKNMPETTSLWYYTNPYHEGTMLHRFMRDGDQTDYGVDEPFIVVKEPNYITCSWGGVKCDDPWNDVQSFDYVSGVISSSLTVISEFQRYYPVWKRKQILGIAGEAGKIIVNPFKYVFKKAFGLD